MPRLDQRRLGGARGGPDAGGALEELPDAHRVGGVVGALIDHLEHVVGTDQARGDLHAARAPAVGQRHLAAAERHLIAGNRHRLEDRPPYHSFGLLVEEREVVAAHASGLTPAWARSVRRRTSSDWKST